MAAGGVLVSVTSYSYTLESLAGRLYGPYLGSAAKKLYEKVSRKLRPKRGGRGGKR